jgi:hypothetical protein
MAIVGTSSGQWVARGVFRQQWTGMTSTAGAGQAMVAPQLPDKTVELSGVIGSGTTVLIEGSNTATNPLSTGGKWYTLNDPQGNALSLATGKIETILENPRMIRPRMTQKNANTSVTVSITAQSMKR